MSLGIKIAIIAASSAIRGAVISQATTFLISFLEKRHQKNILLRQKYEEMMMHFSDSLGWLSKVGSCTNEEDLRALVHNSESRKVLSLCQLYFLDDLADAANNYMAAQSSYFAEVFMAYDPNDQQNKTAGGQALAKSSKIKHEREKLYTAKDTLENLIIKNANKYTVA